MPESHQRRCAWRQCLTQRQQAVQRETPFYVNGGFVGLSRVHRGFLYAWRRAMTLVGAEIGGLERSMFQSGRRIARASHLPSYPFNKTDQDALNIAVMTAPEPVSIMGREGMDFPAGRLDDVARARHGKTVATKIHPRRLLWAAAVVRGSAVNLATPTAPCGPSGRAPCAGAWLTLAIGVPSDVHRRS
jgi:hypothetical protein